ncbi:MAG: hypothetical protein IJZ53_11130 [Tyzzerella sp.]|nr:hypothetical protein [Tyzzerella sp.]
MSKKTELIKVFKDYKMKFDAVQVEIVKINERTEYTPEGRDKALAELLEKFKPIVTNHHDMATGIIDNGLAGLAEKWRKNSTGKLADAGYQAGLANVIKMLELGAIQEKGDLQNIVDTYKDDFSALAVIKKILQKSGIEALRDCAVMIPEDNRERNKQLLNQLKGNVDRYINLEMLKGYSKIWNAYNRGLTDVSVSMDSMSEFVETKLGDNLELLN